MGRPLDESGLQPRMDLTRLSPRHREMMRRLCEGQRPTDIAASMGITDVQLSLITHSPLFATELDKMMEESDQAVTGRLDSLAPEALDKIRDLMRDARSEVLRGRMAFEILDRAGYGKVEKRIIATIDGDAIIRELNRKRADAADAKTEAAIEVENTNGPREDPGASNGTDAGTDNRDTNSSSRTGRGTSGQD